MLYTNLFVDETIISKDELEESQKNYGRFREYIGSREVETNEYIDRDNKESDPFNISKTLNEPFPTNLKKNHYPTFDNYINDISKNRYQKERVTKISVNSADRNKSNYLYPNSFNIPFNRTYTNIQEIRISDLCFPNSVPPVNNFNNALAWQYASKQLLQSNLVDDNIVPVPVDTKVILYSSLPNAVSEIPIGNSNYLVYQAFIVEGYYTTKSLEKIIKDQTSRLVHGATYINLYEQSIRNPGEIFTDKYPFKLPYEEPYYSTKQGISTPTLMNFSIDPVTNAVFAVNRMEEMEVLAIQTFEPGTTSSDLSEMDVFHRYVSSVENTFNSDYIYVTFKQLNLSTVEWYGQENGNICSFPIVFTDVTGELGGIPGNYMNYTEFWDLNVYLENGYPEASLGSISTYKLYDKLEITDNLGVKHKYLRFAFKLSSANINGRRTTGRGGWLILPKSNSTVIYNKSLKESIIIGQTNNGYYGEPITDGQFDLPSAGRSLLFRFIYDLTNNGQYVAYEIDTANLKKRSILNMLAFPVSSSSDETLLVEQKPRFSFVHSNIDAQEIHSDVTQLLRTGLPYFYRAPVNKMNLQIINGEYYFGSVDFLFLKIAPADTPLVYTNMEVAIDNKNQQTNQNYVPNELFNVGIGTDYQCLPSTQRNQIARAKNYYNIFGKILVSPLPMNTMSNVLANTNFAKFYNQPLDVLNGIQIQVLTPDMIVYNLGRDFSFTLEIVEVIDLLKETNIDTKRDVVITTGFKRF